MNTSNKTVKLESHDLEAGVDLRDYFAGKVILGMYCDGSVRDAADFVDEETSMRKAAEWAYAQADAMMQARGKK